MIFLSFLQHGYQIVAKRNLTKLSNKSNNIQNENLWVKCKSNCDFIIKYYIIYHLNFLRIKIKMLYFAK